MYMYMVNRIHVSCVISLYKHAITRQHSKIGYYRPTCFERPEKFYGSLVVSCVRYDTVEEFNVDWKAECGQLNHTYNK